MKRATNRVNLDIHRRILDLIRSGQASTRKDLVALLPAAQSTVSLRTRELIEAGELVDGGHLDSTGGRPTGILKPASAARSLLVADLGTTHARIGLARGDGTLLEAHTTAINASHGPENVINTLVSAFETAINAHPPLGRPVGMCVGLPAPIDHAKGWVDTGSRLRGWHHFPIADRLRNHFKIPVFVENDADIMALGEHLAHPGIRHSITVKAGMSVGVGVVIDSALHRGATGAAGDISHVRMPAFGNLPCACGKSGCLDTVVSGTALTRQWTDIVSTDSQFTDLLDAATNGDVRAITLLRTAGSRLGEAMSAVAGFFNPDAIFIGGLTSTSEDFITAIRASLYTNCHPLITRNLIIEPTTTSHNAGILGAIHLAMNHSQVRSA